MMDSLEPARAAMREAERQGVTAALREAREIQYEPTQKSDGPQPLLRETPPASPYPVTSLGALRPVVEAVQGQALAPVAIPAASALAVASLAVQGFSDVETLAGPRPLSLYFLTIAKSGERKSSCDEPMMAALREHEQQKAKDRYTEIETWRNRHAVWKAERDAILAEARKVRKARGRKGKEVQADLDALWREPAAPPLADRTVTEPTFEGLTRLFAEGLPSLGIFSDEGGQFLGGHGMNNENRQKTLAALNGLWQGAPIRRTRAGDGHATLYSRRLAVHLMVQPVVARTFMADPLAGESGFLPRFLMCEPVSTIGSRIHAKARRGDGALAAFSDRLREILETPLPMEPETRTLQPRTVPLSADARALLVSFSDTIEVGQAPGGDLAHVTAYASKVAEHAARIAGVLTLWCDLDAPEVKAEAMADAIGLAHFYLDEARRLADVSTVSPEIERAEKLRRWLLESWPEVEVMVRDVVQYGPNQLRESVKARHALLLLASHGWVEPLESGAIVRGKSRKEAWHIVKESDDAV